MSFTQEKQTNIKRCHGCDKCCELGYTVDMNNTTAWVQYYPTIGGQKITKYIDATGNTIKIKLSCLKTDRHASHHATDAINQARVITKFCDHYKTR